MIHGIKMEMLADADRKTAPTEFSEADNRMAEKAMLEAQRRKQAEMRTG